MTYTIVQRGITGLIICKNENVLMASYWETESWNFFRFSRRIRQFQAFLKKNSSFMHFFKNAWNCLIRLENQKKISTLSFSVRCRQNISVFTYYDTWDTPLYGGICHVLWIFFLSKQHFKIYVCFKTWKTHRETAL